MERASRIPWYSIALTLIVAIAVYVLAAVFAAGRLADVRRDAVASQQQRLNHSAETLEQYLSVTAQIARFGTDILNRNPRADLRVGMLRMYRASDRTLVSGLGIFYDPSISPHLHGVYISDAEKWTIVGENSTYPFQTRPWYVAARNANGSVAFTGPYVSPSKKVFLGASQAFYAKGKLAGVVLVEALQSGLDRALAQSVAPHEQAYVTDSSGKIVLGHVPANAPSTVEARLRLAAWTIHLTSTLPTYARALATLRGFAISFTVAYVALTSLILWLLIRIRRFQLQAKKLRKTASRDALTGLYNRYYMMETLEEALRGEAPSFATLFIDLDNFAVINDSLGHHVGDLLLKEVGARMTDELPDAAVCGRIGGDEFVVHLPGEISLDHAHAVAHALVDRLRHPFAIEGRDLYISASVGVVLSDHRYKDAEELLRDADTAMYSAKHAGPGRIAMFDDEMHARAVERMELENELRHAARNQEFVAYYQPLVNIDTGRVDSLEALVRWQNGELKPISPAVFVPIAEQTGVIAAIDSFMLRQACADAQRLQERFPGMKVAVNVSATHLVHGDFSQRLAEALAETNLAPELLKIELTETAVMERPDLALDVLKSIRNVGPQIWIDDFGTGHSSLSYAQKLPISGLKIDRSFIEPLPHDPQSAAIVRAIVALARTLGLEVTAEGIETQAQLDLLKTMGVHYAQGFLFAPALTYDSLCEYVNSVNGAPV